MEIGLGKFYFTIDFTGGVGDTMSFAVRFNAVLCFVGREILMLTVWEMDS